MRHLLSIALLAALSLSPALAQIGAETPDEANARALEQQAADVQRLIHRAEELALDKSGRIDPDIYYATLLTGWGYIAGQGEAEGRSGEVVPEAHEILDTLIPDDEATAWIAADPSIKSTLDNLLEMSGNERIVGGAMLWPGLSRQTVAIVTGDRRLGCTGVVIHPNWVLTAAHCVCDLQLDREPIVGDIIFADPFVSDQTPPVRILEAKTPDNWSCSTFRATRQICSSDLALLHYDDIGAPADIPVAKIPSAEEVAELIDNNGRATVVGFGAVRAPGNGGGSAVRPWNPLKVNPKQFGVIPITRECTADVACPAVPSGCNLGSDLRAIDNRTWLPDSALVDTCRGDSGGPIFLSRPFDNPRVFGITSRAIDPNGKCGPGGIYAKTFTPEAKQWISEVIPDIQFD